MEKRRAIRYKKRLNVSFGTDKPDNIGFVEDISSTGVRIKTNHVFKPGTVLKLSIVDNNITMLAEGIVTWARKAPPELMRVTRCGMGIAFLKMDVNLIHYFEEKKVM